MVFSDSTNLSGIVEQARDIARVDSAQWSTNKITNSVNNWLDKIFTYGKWKDRQFRLDDTNHTKLPEGTTNIVAGQSDYSFLTDEQGNRITNLTGASILTNGKYVPLELVDRNDTDVNPATFGTVSGVPTKYDKIADNVVRLDMLPVSNITNGLKYYFQRTPSYFTAADTTKQPGVSNDLHRGFVIAAAYDAAFTLGLDNLPTLTIELQKEEKKLSDYFSSRNTDARGGMRPARENNK